MNDLQANGYTYVRFDKEERCHVLRNEDGELEKWFARANHASFTLRWRNTDLEFASGIPYATESAKDMLRFLAKYPGWHSFAKDKETVEAACALSNRRDCNVNEYHQAKITKQGRDNAEKLDRK